MNAYQALGCLMITVAVVVLVACHVSPAAASCTYQRSSTSVLLSDISAHGYDDHAKSNGHDCWGGHPLNCINDTVGGLYGNIQDTKLKTCDYIPAHGYYDSKIYDFQKNQKYDTFWVYTSAYKHNGFQIDETHWFCIAVYQAKTTCVPVD